jgi:hypothetical protein
MRRLAVILIGLLALSSVPIVRALDVDGGGGGNMAACATGFTRFAPGICRRNHAVNTAQESWADVVACTAHSVHLNIPTTAKSVDLLLGWAAMSNNLVGNRLNTVSFWPDVACTSGAMAASIEYEAYEFVATVAGTEIAFLDTFVPGVPLVNEAGVMKIRAKQSNTGGNGQANLQYAITLAYYD